MIRRLTLEEHAARVEKAAERVARSAERVAMAADLVELNRAKMEALGPPEPFPFWPWNRRRRTT